MTAPEGNAERAKRPDRESPPAPSSVSGTTDSPAPDGDAATRPEILKKRRDFLAAARARRWVAPGLILQGRRRRDSEPGDPAAVRVGYTCSKKVGNAVARNRAKRRLRAAVAEVLPGAGRPGWDYVLIGKAEATAARPFADLVGDLAKAIARVHEPKRRK